MRSVPAWLVAAVAMACSANAQASLEMRTKWQDLCTGEPGSSASGFADESTPSGQGGVVTPAAAGIVPNLIAGTLVNLFAAKFEEQAAAQETTPIQSPPVVSRLYVLSETGELLPRRRIGCLVVVLGEPTKQVSADMVLPEDGLSIEESEFTPHLRFEMRLWRDATAKYQRLVPRYLKVHRFQLESWFRRDRTLKFSVNLAGLFAEKPFATATFTFSGLEMGEEIRPGDPRLLAAAGPLIELQPELSDAMAKRDSQRAFVAPAIRAKALLDTGGSSGPDPMSYEGVVKGFPTQYKVTVNASGQIVSPAEPYCSELAARNKAVGEALATHDEQCFALLRQAKENAEAELKQRAQKKAQALCDAANARTDRANCLPGYKPGLFETAGGKVMRTTGYFIHSAAVTEVRPKSLFGTAVAKAFSDNAETLTTKISDKLSNSKQKEANDAKAAAARDSRRVVLLADQEVQLAQLEYDAALSNGSEASVQAKSIALIKAKMSANDAYRAAGLAPPFPEYD